MPRPYDRVLTKLDEARFFFARFANTSNVRQAEFYFDAFLTAARSITFTLQAVCAHLPNFNAWYAVEQAALAADPMTRFLVDLRNETQKVGLVPVHRSGVGTRLSRGGRFHCQVAYRLAALDGGTAPPAGEVRAACQEHLHHLAQVVDRCYVQYAADVDPGGTLRPMLDTLMRPVRVVVPQCPLDRAMHRTLGSKYRAILTEARKEVSSRKRTGRERRRLR
jgi:hypothetical protein